MKKQVKHKIIITVYEMPDGEEVVRVTMNPLPNTTLIGILEMAKYTCIESSKPTKP